MRKHRNTEVAFTCLKERLALEIKIEKYMMII